MNSPYTPTEAELEILHILWEHGPSSVREVNTILNENRSIGYTTTLKTMQIMNEKGLCERNTDQRTHIYAAAVQKKNTQKNILTDLVNTVFKGSTTSMILQALGDGQTSDAELEEIKQYIQKLKSK